MAWHGSVRLNVEEWASGLAAAWAVKWPDNYLFEDTAFTSTDRWVRFHYLPNSARLPENEEQDLEVLHRYRSILAALSRSASRSVLFVAESQVWDQEQFQAQGVEPLDPPLRRLVPQAKVAATRFERIHAGYATWMWVAELTVDDPLVDTLLLRAASDDSGSFTLYSPDFSWIFAPYSGGLDLLLDSRERRDALAAQFADWLSPQHEWEDEDVRPSDQD